MKDAIAVAMSLSAQYGEDAVVIATLRAAESAAMGDQEMLDHWDAVIEYLEYGPNSDRHN